MFMWNVNGKFVHTFTWRDWEKYSDLQFQPFDLHLALDLCLKYCRPSQSEQRHSTSGKHGLYNRAPVLATFGVYKQTLFFSGLLSWRQIFCVLSHKKNEVNSRSVGSCEDLGRLSLSFFLVLCTFLRCRANQWWTVTK